MVVLLEHKHAGRRRLVVQYNYPRQAQPPVKRMNFSGYIEENIEYRHNMRIGHPGILESIRQEWLAPDHQ